MAGCNLILQSRSRGGHAAFVIFFGKNLVHLSLGTNASNSLDVDQKNVIARVQMKFMKTVPLDFEKN